MLQELFRIPGLDLPVYGYGLMLVLGVWTAIEVGRRLAERVGINGDHFVTMGLLALAAGVVGARLSHVLENLDIYTSSERSAWANFVAAINIRGGGLTFYGGFLLATPTLIGYAIWRKIPIRLGMDIVAPCLMIGLAFGRVGCLLNGCCWGQACELPWAVQFPYGSPPYVGAFEDGDLKAVEDVPPALIGTTEDGRRVLLDKAKVQANPELASIASRQHTHGLHPTQIYSTINASLIAGVCLAFFTMRRSTGQNFAVMLLLYGVGRFCLELVRTEPAVATIGSLGLSFSMCVSLGVFSGGIAWWLICQRFYRAAPSASGDGPPAKPKLTAD